MNEPAVSDQDPPTAGSNVIPPIMSYLGDPTINVHFYDSGLRHWSQLRYQGGDRCGGCNSSPPAPA